MEAHISVITIGVWFREISCLLSRWLGFANERDYRHWVQRWWNASI